MQSKVASLVDPNSDVEESRIYIQTGKVKRRWQLSFFEKYHEISLKIMAWEEVPRNSIKELAIIGKKNIKKIALDMLPYWWNYMKGTDLEVDILSFFTHARYPWTLALYRSLALRVANCCYVFKVTVDYSMALMWEWLEEKKMHK